MKILKLEIQHLKLKICKVTLTTDWNGKRVNEFEDRAIECIWAVKTKDWKKWKISVSYDGTERRSNIYIHLCVCVCVFILVVSEKEKKPLRKYLDSFPKFGERYKFTHLESLIELQEENRIVKKTTSGHITVKLETTV